MLRSTMLEGHDHFLQAPIIYPRPCDPVKMDVLPLTIRARPFHNGKSAGLPTATTAIIRPGARLKAIPTIPAQIMIGFTDALATMNANSRPKELMKALQDKNTCFLDRMVGLYRLCFIHVRYYTAQMKK